MYVFFVSQLGYVAQAKNMKHVQDMQPQAPALPLFLLLKGPEHVGHVGYTRPDS